MVIILKPTFSIYFAGSEYLILFLKNWQFIEIFRKGTENMQSD